jgi:predicted permease
MICRHCGKEYSGEFAYCPYCAEPVTKSNVEFTKLKHLTREERATRSYKIVTVVVAVLLFFSMFFIGQFLGWKIYPETLGNDAFHDEADTFAIIFWISTIVVWVVSRWIYWLITKDKLMNKRIKKQIITDQFMVEATSICPKCGSHDIKLYRKGYNYKVGFLGAIFGVRGAGYAGGFDANHTCCRCMNCGNDWETDYDYRLINK